MNITECMLDKLCTKIHFDRSKYREYQYASKLSNFDDFFIHNGEKPSIAIMTSGENPDIYSGFRSALYRMSANFHSGQIIDLGMIKGGHTGVTEVCDVLLQKGICSIVINCDDQLPTALLRAYSNRQKPVHLSVAESKIDYNWMNEEQEKGLLDNLMLYYPKLLTRLNFLGYQSYFVDEKVLELLRLVHFEAHRIGVLRNNISETEPILRDSDIFAMNLSSIAYTDAPGTISANPNGFSAAESCQIVRYAAMSDRLSCMGFYGFAPEADTKNLTGLLLAQLVWYAVQGYFQRKYDDPLENGDFTRYEVYLSGDSVPIAFFKSHKSERWWFYVAPNQSSESLDPEGLISCSYEDYLKACEGDVPDRLLNALGRE